jgi:hypothetical protein
MLGPITEVLGYGGSLALTYRMRQATALGAEHVIPGITRPALQTCLRLWGLETTAPSEDDATLLARSHGINFRIHLIAPQESAPDVYWEVHCRTQFAIPRKRVADLLAEVNGKAWLVKAYESPVSEKGTGAVWFSYGFNIAGGVTPNHLKSQIFEWLENVRQLRLEWRRPLAPRTDTEHRAAGTVH